LRRRPCGSPSDRSPAHQQNQPRQRDFAAKKTGQPGKIDCWPPKKHPEQEARGGRLRSLTRCPRRASVAPRFRESSRVTVLTGITDSTVAPPLGAGSEYHASDPNNPAAPTAKAPHQPGSPSPAAFRTCSHLLPLILRSSALRRSCRDSVFPPAMRYRAPHAVDVHNSHGRSRRSLRFRRTVNIGKWYTVCSNLVDQISNENGPFPFAASGATP
jgi:hypothetical protein